MATCRRDEPNQEELHRLFDYNYETGGLYWRVNRSSRAKNGNRAGSLHHSGYRKIAVNRRTYLEHRLVFVWHHGYSPENEVDHINRIKDDNRIENLREVSRSCNMFNSKIRSNNKSGVTGVSFNNNKNGWVSQIYKNGHTKYLGCNKDLTQAVIIRWKAEVELGIDNCLSSPAYMYLNENGLIDENGAIKEAA